MTKIDLERIKEILWEIYKENNRPLHKSDIDNCKDLPSYNTCLRRGIVLHKLNAEFSERKYHLTPKTCKECSSPIPYEKRHSHTFCSHSCSATYHNAARAAKANDGRGYSVTCLSCGTKISDTYTGRKYCDHVCQHNYSFETRFRDWYEHGKSFENRTLRDFLTIWKGYSCEHCGIFEWNGKAIALEVEHIDGNSENNAPDNVCLLCPNCHSQTPTYKGRNIGNGRHARRLRYKDGKSY